MIYWGRLATLHCSVEVRGQLPVGHAKLGVIKRTPTAVQPRSYIVTGGNKDYRRSRRNLSKVLEPTWKVDSEILEHNQKVTCCYLSVVELFPTKL